MVKRVIQKLLIKVPVRLLNIIFFFIGEDKLRFVMKQRTIIFLKRFYLRPNKCISKLSKAKKYVIINYTTCTHKSFSAYYISMLLSECLYYMVRGFIPVISKTGRCKMWHDYYKQPYSCVDILNNLKARKTFKQKTKLDPPFVLKDNILGDDDTIIKASRLFYKTFLKLNDDIDEVVKSELNRFNSKTSNMLGAILRGTDYIKTKPKYHHIQPSIELFSKEIIKEYRLGCYQNLYFATEQREYFEYVSKQIKQAGGECFNNSNVFLSDYYNESGLIGDCVSDDINESVSLSYLSSLYLLAESKTIVAAFSSGLFFATMIAETLPKLIIIDLGFYS